MSHLSFQYNINYFFSPIPLINVTLVFESNMNITLFHLFKSIGGREVLIKYVLQAIPTYCMSIFQIPQPLGDELKKMMNSDW